MSRRWVRWMPAAAMPAVVAGIVLAAPLKAAAPPELPAKTAAQLLDMVAASHATAFSGTVNQTVDLGLPQLPDGAMGSGESSGSPSAGVAPSAGSGGGSSDSSNVLSPANIASLVSALTTPHTARVYVAGATKVRIQVLDRLAERDFIRNGDIAWSYDSASDAVNRWELPQKTAATEPAPEAPVQTPADLAAKLLKNVDPSTQVAVGDNTRVAGRDAYVLDLTPRVSGTLVGRISVAVDAETGLALKFTVESRQSGRTAFEVGFSQISLQAPAASVFAFTPPAGATVTQHSLPAKPAATGPHATTPDGTGPSAEPPNTAKPGITGTGWAAIVESPAGTVPASLAANPALGMLLHQVSGGQALETTLFSILVTPDGRALAGAVPLASLQAAAATK